MGREGKRNDFRRMPHVEVGKKEQVEAFGALATK